MTHIWRGSYIDPKDSLEQKPWRIWYTSGDSYALKDGIYTNFFSPVYIFGIKTPWFKMKRVFD